jgi:hypothetical protein
MSICLLKLFDGFYLFLVHLDLFLLLQSLDLAIGDFYFS